EGIIDVACHSIRVRADALVRSIVRHVFVNVARQLLNRPIPAQHIVVFTLHPFAIAPMAFGTELAEDFAPLLVLFRAARALLARQQAKQRDPGEPVNWFNPERFGCFWGARASRALWS